MDIKKIIMLCLMMGLMIGVASAMEWDNKLIYSEDDLKVELKNWWGLGKDYGTAKLKSHTSVDQIKKVVVGNPVVMWYDFNFTELYKEGIGQVKFLDMRTGEVINRNYKYVYLGEEQYYTDVYSETLMKNGTSINSKVGQEIKTRQAWLDYNSLDIPKGDLTIGIEVETLPRDYVDVVWEIGGKEITKHAAYETVSVSFQESNIGGAGTNYLYSGVALGTADPNRMIVIAAGSGQNGVWVNSITVVDEEATRIVNATQGIMTTELWAVDLPTGTTGDIYINYTGAETRAGMGVWAVYDTSVANVNDTAFAFGGANTSINASSNSIIIGYSATTANTGTIAWFGTPNARFDEGISGATYQAGADETFVAAQSNLLVGAIRPSTNADDGSVFASWRGNLILADLDVTLNSPINNTNSTTQTIIFNCTATATASYNLINVSLILDGVVNETNSSGINNTNYIFPKTIADGDHNWTCSAFNNNSESATADLRIFTIDSTKPSLIISSPTGTINFHEINTNLSLNWTVSDPHLSNCIYNYNGTNMTVTCNDNQTNINVTDIYNNNLTFWANDTFGNTNTSLTSWDYKIFQHEISYNAETIEGSTEEFTLNVTILDTLQISLASLIYDGSSSIGSSSASTGNVLVSEEIIIPNVESNTTLSFYWSFILSDSSIVNTSSYSQSVLYIDFDNCSANTNLIYNYSLVEEENSSILSNTTIEIEINLLSTNRQVTVLNFSELYTNTNPAQVCLNLSLSSANNYSLDSIVRYEAFSHAVEYYNILNYTLSNSSGIQNVTLYDLNSADSTEFQLTFTGSDFSPVENALVYIDRQYISEGQFKTVELPRTDSNGQTVLHLVRNDVIYNIRIVKDGVLLANFENIIAFCEDFTIGDCKINLNAAGTGGDIYDYDTSLGITFSGPDYNSTSNEITFNFVTADGSQKLLYMNVTRDDIFGNRSICNNALVSSSGTLSCSIDPNLDESVLRVNVYVNGDLIVQDSVTLDPSNLGTPGYLIFFVMAVSMILIFSGSKTEILFGIFLSFAGAVGLGILNADVIGLSSAGIWLAVAMVIGVWKLNKERQQ